MLDYGMTPEQALSAPRLDPSTPTILIDREAGADVAAKVGESYPVQIVTNALHPVQFAVPSVVTARPDGRHVGMAHPLSPWAMAVAEDAHG
jgi:gamma-glutamyltranspeptidase/glutathione hydrolase